jgi:acyl-CoA thioesterase FadM
MEGRAMIVSTKSPASSQDFRIPVRVYYEDTSAGSVVYDANNLRFPRMCSQ